MKQIIYFDTLQAETFEKFFEERFATKNDHNSLKQDVHILKEDVSILKKDVNILKQDVTILKQDVSVLKQDVSVIKQDIIAIKQDINTLNITTKHEIENLRITTKSDMDLRFAQAAVNLGKVKTEIIQWVVGIFITQGIATFSLLKFFH